MTLPLLLLLIVRWTAEFIFTTVKKQSNADRNGRAIGTEKQLHGIVSLLDFLNIADRADSRQWRWTSCMVGSRTIQALWMEISDSSTNF